MRTKALVDGANGLYEKFSVRPNPKGIPFQFEYFVLKPKYDVAAREALLTYANHCHPKLAAQIRAWMVMLQGEDLAHEGRQSLRNLGISITR